MKKLRIKAVAAIISALCLTIIIPLFPSCEIGLGGAVDTQPPTITIDSPKVDAVIRDVFVMSGTWTDDGTIKSISVFLKKTDGSGTEKEIKGKWEKGSKENGTWKAIIDYREANLIDGTYQATVEIKDKGEHKTTQSTTFTIDNTPPVLVLSRPSTKLSARGYDSYGRTVTLEGKAADDNDVSLIEVSIYKDSSCSDESLIKTVELKNIPLTIEQDIAKYTENPVPGETDTYSLIYEEEGQEENATAYRFCKIRIYDDAQRYPVDESTLTEEERLQNSKGNCTETYYMNSEIQGILSEYKITDLYHIKNGTFFDDNSRSASPEQVSIDLASKEVTASQFSLNPANNPKYVVTSRNFLDRSKNHTLEHEDYQLTSGNSFIEVEITPGLDKFEIEPDTVGVYLKKCSPEGVVEKDSNGNELPAICLIGVGAENHIADKATITQSGSTYKFKTPTPISKENYPGLAIGNYYLIDVVGNDSQGPDTGKIIAEGLYGFKLKANGEVIELIAHNYPEYVSENPDAWTVPGHETFTVTLNWKTGDSPFEIYRDGKQDPVQTVTEKTEVDGELKWQATETFTYAQLHALASGGNVLPSALYYSIKKGGDTISTTATVNIKIDSTTQSISNVQFTNSYEKVEEIEVNGQMEENSTYYVRNQSGNTCTISGIATDDTGIESVKLEVPGLTIDPVPTGRFKFENIDFSTLSVPGLTATITATDVAGNQMTYPLDIVFDTTPPHGVHAIDASSKNLYLRVGNSDNDDITSEDDLWDDNLDKGVGGKYGNGTFGNATTIQIRGNFSDKEENGEDGSGVAMIYYKVYPDEHLLSADPVVAAAEIETIKAQVIASPTDKFAPLSTPETRRVFYNVGKKLNAQGNPVNPPVPDEDQIFDGSTQFTDTPNSKGYYKYYKNVETTFNQTIAGFKEGNNFLVFVAVDKVGNSAIDAAVVNFNGVDTTFVNYSLNVDTTPPSDITTLSTNGILYTNGTDIPLLWGTVSDKTSTKDAQGNMIAAGLRSFILTRDGVNKTVTATLREVRTQTDGQGNPADSTELQELAEEDPTLRIWEADISSLLPDESKTISISATATDDAGVGNTTPGVVATITIDKDAPTVTIAEDSPADADSSDNIVQVNGIISINGTSDDSNGIDELVGLYYKEEGTDTWIPVSATKSGTVNWKFTDIDTTKLDGTNPIADGTHIEFRVAVKDKAGNIGYSTVCPVVVDQDTDRPVIHLTSLPLTGMTNSNYVWFNRSELTGTVDDDDGAVQYVKVIAKDASDSSDCDWENTANAYKNGIWSYTIPSNGSKKIYFQVKDKKGNVFTSNTNSTNAASYGPKIQDTDALKFGYTGTGSTADDILYVKVDTDDPILDNMYYYTSPVLVDNPETAIPDYNPYTQTPGWKIAESSIITDKFGGDNKYLYIKCKTHDTNGISAVSFKFGDINPLDGKTVEISQAPGQENYKEIITCFNINKYPNPVPSGLTKLEINIKDNAAANTGSSGISKYYEAMVDNTEPEINFSNYTKGSQVYGSSAVTLRGTTSDSSRVEKVEYALSTNGWAVPNDGWVEITDETKPTYTSKLGWQIVFDGKTPENDNEFTDPSSYHTDLLKKSLFSLYNIAEENQAAYDTTKRIYIWMRATDELGNKGTNVMDDEEGGFYLNVIPNGDRPAIQITYPANGSSVGGTIRITGTTDIQDTSASVKYVYLQIDPSYDSVEGFNEAGWASELQGLLNAKGVTSYHITDLSTAGENGGPVVVNGTTNLGTVIGNGIASQGNSKMNWYLTINGNKEFNGKVNEQNRTIAIRAAAVSSTGKVSFSEAYTCTIDPDAPTFGQINELRFVQYSDNALTIESASRKFENGIYLKGQWYLVGSVEDDSGIREIQLGSQSIVYSTGEEGAEVVTNASEGKAIEIQIAPGNRFSNYNLKIPVGNEAENEFGKIEYEISVIDGSTSRSTNDLKFTIFYDNKPPVFTANLGNGNPLVNNTGKIYQSNGTYTVAGSYTELSEGQNNQSGFKRIAMFFTRERVVEGTRTLYLIDPMVASGTEGEDNFIQLGTYNNGGTFIPSANVEQKEGLFWRKVTASLESENQLSFAAGPVYAGGLCMIDNVSYRIKSVNGSVATLEGSISDFTGKTVYIAYAQIIDNLSQESGITSLYSTTDTTINQDGDCMVEGVQFSGGIYNWNAEIDSSNMLDGNVSMCFVAYDAAGNYTEQIWNQKISNNAPRIAGVSFGTDIDLDGNISDDDEVIIRYLERFTNVLNVRDGLYYNGEDEEGNRQTEYTVPETLTVKGALKVKPMIVGGNTGLGWEYTYKNTSGNTLSSGVTEYNGIGHSSDGSVRASDLTINISLKDFLNIQVAEGEQNLKFTIWDKTDGSTIGNEASGSAKADIILPVNIIISDSKAPTATLEPFYWNSVVDNSLYQKDAANGHIELENELPGTFTAGGSGVNDRDAKVSGKITFRGTAKDNVIVEIIKAKIPGFNNEFIIAQRQNGVWVSDNNAANGASLFDVDDEHPGTAKPWVFELLSDDYDAEGNNIIDFKFHFDTEKITTVAATNVKIQFIAIDKGSPSVSGNNIVYNNAKPSVPGDTTTTLETPTGCYNVDIVPYITKVYSSLAKLKNNNWSVYNRTAKGHYPVSADETIELYGFNLGDDTYKPKYGETVLTAPAGGKISFPVSNVTASGELEITVNNVPSLNNKNNKDAKGSYTGTTTSATGDKTIFDNYYNRKPNGDNNNLLTDDVVLDVWEIDPQAVKPVNGYATQPVMAINPVTHDVGFAFVNGTLYYSMPNGNNGENTYSYDLFIGGYDFWTSVGFAYDKLGYSYGTAAGGDIADNRADTFRIMTSRWGYANRDVNGYNDGLNQYRLEWIAQADYDSEGNLTRNFNKERVRSPSITTTAATEDSTTLYLAYYDEINNEIRFKWGYMPKTKNPDWYTNRNTNEQKATFLGDYYGENKDGNNGESNGKNTLEAHLGNYRLEHNSLIAGQTINKYTKNDKTTKVTTAVTTTGGVAVNAGKYVSIASIEDGGNNDDVVIAVWWDSENNQMLYSYNEAPKSINVGKYSQADTGWSTPVPIFGEGNGIGEYCKVVVDKHNGVHIAAYDGLGGDLWYAFISDYSSPDDAKICIVDSYGIIGTEINLDVALDSNNTPIPYISYYAGSCGRPKTAHWVGSMSLEADDITQSMMDSTDDEAFTGAWEVSVIPTTSKVSSDHINVGVWKNSDGVITYSTTDGLAPSESNIGTTELSYKESFYRMVSNSKSYGYKTGGQVYGNGSKNPILGYAVTKGSAGYIETAQMK